MKYIALMIALCQLSNPQLTRDKVRTNFKAEDFVFNLEGKKSDTKGEGGTQKVLTAAQWPALFDEGVSFALLSLKPCSINLHNTHQFASEIIYVIDADKLQVGFVEEDGGRVIVNTLSTGGLIHYQMNLGCKTAKYLSAFNSDDPGLVTISLQSFKFPHQALASEFQLSESQIESLKKGLPANVANGRDECLKLCG